MPTIDELKTLVYCSNGKHKEGYCNDGSERPTINQQAFPNADAVVWSGSNSGYAWYVYYFNYGSLLLSETKCLRISYAGGTENNIGYSSGISVNKSIKG